MPTYTQQKLMEHENHKNANLRKKQFWREQQLIVLFLKNK